MGKKNSFLHILYVSHLCLLYLDGAPLLVDHAPVLLPVVLDTDGELAGPGGRRDRDAALRRRSRERTRAGEVVVVDADAARSEVHPDHVDIVII